MSNLLIEEEVLSPSFTGAHSNVREQLLNAVWGADVYVEERTVDVHIGRLRKSLNVGGEEDPIRTVRAAGYSLDESFGANA